MLVSVLHRRASASRAPADFDLTLEVQIGEAFPEHPSDASPRGGALALNSLTEVERAQLAALLNDLADEAAVRRNPLVEDLGNEDRHRELETRLRAWGPSFSAAASLASGAWSSADGTMTVKVSPACAPRPPSTLCLSFARASEATGPIEHRARLFAWPIAHAVVLRTAGAGQARSLAESMRSKLDREKTAIALVLERSELHGLRKSLELASVARATERLMDQLGDAGALSGAEGDLLVRLARSTTTRDELPWLALPEGTVLVVPRLGALAARASFVAEIERLAGDTHLPFDTIFEGE